VTARRFEFAAAVVSGALAAAVPVRAEVVQLSVNGLVVGGSATTTAASAE